MLRYVSLLVFAIGLVSCHVAADNIQDVRLSQADDTVRLVFELGAEPSFTYFALSNPHRLVVDLKNVLPTKDLAAFNISSSLVKRIRYSTPKTAKDSRIVIELHRKAAPSLFALKPDSSSAARLVIDLLDSEPSLNAAKTPPKTTPKTKSPSAPKVILDDTSISQRDIIVAIDAGHGGKDPGSVGPAGTFEKRITLSVAKLLEQKINATKGMRAIMTRTRDVYISPNMRPEIARRKKADVFVSIHADAFHQPEPRGASVWVLSVRRADNELGRWMERTQRHSELLGGAAEVITDKANERYLTETILGLSMDHSMASSYDLSEMVIKEMRQITKMHQAKPQSASLAVLTSPDIPSILVELGFISNPQEEKNLNWSKYRGKLANSIYTALSGYLAQNPPDGTSWATQKKTIRTHKVRSGESLSLLAQRYNVSVKNIKAANNLSSDIVQVGQTLNIPKS